MTRKTRIRVGLATATAVVTTLTVAGVSAAGPRHPDARPTKAEITALFEGWNAALKTGDPKKVADRYANDAVLLPTVSNKIRTSHAEIEDYFQHFLRKKPVGKKIRTIVKVLDGNSAIDTGVYQFTVVDPKTGTKRTVEARYTYEYEKQPNGNWLIVNHHSSAMPEG
ncbi:SgcJ/EcaC family oxidoreductase [Streptomyces sp. Ru72]|uniref:SgcJ/EcaC family oxidoreductase n=1 Tax=Streptomyces sp. Ru72 TaxID=2080747 RepID=UPI000CDDBD6C|nr:SgcJ/EcaC family oxidoreductase [Streptomyces sp. Ru72]POX50942.1 DUF4440 domain-containing protein [Streptomyces sp. Ru72]